MSAKEETVAERCVRISTPVLEALFREIGEDPKTARPRLIEAFGRLTAEEEELFAGVSDEQIADEVTEMFILLAPPELRRRMQRFQRLN
jgi:hypothetical protein